jgi:hypothetical protein
VKNSSFQSNQELIMNYLQRMNWIPQSVETKESNILIKISVDLEYKILDLLLRFRDDGIWLFISSVLMDLNSDNLENIYKRLLEINFSTTLTKYGLSEGVVYALIELPLYSLDFEEFQSGLKRIVNDINKHYLQLEELLKNS